MQFANQPSRTCVRCRAPLNEWSLASVCWACMLDSTIGERAQPVASVAEPEATTFGDYVLEEQVAHGGMGVIYRATQRSLNRKVAVKLLLLGRYSSAESIERFHREAQSAAALRHPNIVAIHEVGEHDGQHFLSMDYIEGRSLAEEIRARPMEPRRAAEVARDVARAIHYAHEHGVLHRDIKPSNILLDVFGQVRITDFGLAKKLDGSSDLTLTGQMVGTPNYLSPEQAAGKHAEVGPASDVYSIGALLYELLTGRPPFLANSLSETLLRIRDEPPLNPRAHNPALQGDLETIALKCLRKEPGRRYATASALGDDLHRWLQHLPIEARPTPVIERACLWCQRKPRQAFLLAATVLALLAVFITLTVSNIRIRAARAVAQRNAQSNREMLLRRYVAEGNRLMELGNPLAALPWLVHAVEMERGDRQREPQGQLRIASALQDAPDLLHHVTEGRWIHILSFSPDGRFIGAGSENRRVRIINASNGADRIPPIVMRGPVRGVQFSADGSTVLAMDAAGWAAVWNTTNGSRVTPFLRPKDYDGEAVSGIIRTAVPSACFSPDGRTILTAWGSKAAHLWEAATGKHLRAFAHGKLVNHAEFSADGLYVITSSRDGTARIWDATNGTLAAAPLKASGTVNRALFSSDGRHVLTLSDRRRIQLWNWKTGERRGSTIENGSYFFQMAFSPDARLFAVAGWDRFARVYRVSDAQELRRLRHPGGVVNLNFCGDSSQLATASHDGYARIWKLDRDQDDPFVALPHGAEADYAAFSPDGSQLAVGGYQGIGRVWHLPESKRSAWRYTAASQIHWAEFDPKGRWFVIAGGPKEGAVQVFDAETMKLVSSPQGCDSRFQLSFSPTGERLLIVCNHNVHVCDVRTGAEVFPPLAHGEISDARWSPDGRFIATGAGPEGTSLWSASTGEHLQRYPASNQLGVVGVAFSPDGNLLLAGIRDREIQVWDTRTHRPAMRPVPSPNRVRDVRFNPNGRSFAFSSHTRGSLGRALLFDSAAGRPIGLPMVHTDELLDLNFSPDGRWLLTSGEDYRARVWDAATALPVSPWLPHADEVRDTQVSRDHNLLATLTSSGELRLWNPRTGEPITPPLPHPDCTWHRKLAISPDGRKILLALGGRTAWLHTLPDSPGSLETLKLRARVLSCSEVDASGDLVMLDSAALSKAWNQLQTVRKQ